MNYNGVQCILMVSTQLLLDDLFLSKFMFPVLCIELTWYMGVLVLYIELTWYMGVSALHIEITWYMGVLGLYIELTWYMSV